VVYGKEFRYFVSRRFIREKIREINFKAEVEKKQW